jgi:hypothetical protein
MGAFFKIACWLNGWRYDLDGWLVRARRQSDPDLKLLPEYGFTEECAIAVRTPYLARQIDAGKLTKEECRA